MRLILVDHARSQRAIKRGGHGTEVTLQESMVLSPSHPPEVLDLHEALDALTKIDARKASVIELRYFGGMDREEIATSLGLTLSTVKRDLRLGQAWLRRFLVGADAR